MKISEYIALLETIKAEHGDLDVDSDYPSGRRDANSPTIAYRKILTKRESRSAFWSKHDARALENKGEKVCRV